MPPGLATPGVGAHVQSVVSPPKRITGDCRGASLRTSASNTVSGCSGAPKYAGAEWYSMERPTNPGGIGRLSGRPEMVTRIADGGSFGCALACWPDPVARPPADCRAGATCRPGRVLGAPADSVVATPADTATRAATGRMRAGRMPRRYRARRLTTGAAAAVCLDIAVKAA